MMFNNFWPLYITLTFDHNNSCYHLFTMVDKNAFDFNNFNFGIKCAFKKKNQNFSNSVK